MPLSNGQVQFSMSAAESVPNPAGGSDTHGASYSNYWTLSDGTGPALNATQGYAKKVGDKQFVTSTSITNIDLTAFAGGIGGAAINFSLVKQVLIRNLDPTNSVTVTCNGTNGWTNYVSGTFTLAPYDVRFVECQFAGIVVDATHKIIGLTAVAGTPTVQITIVGDGT